MEIRELEDEGDRRNAVSILGQLWDHVPPAEILEWTGDPDYHLFGGFADGDLVCVAGASIEHLLHHARHAWLSDLVVDEPRRGEGHGSALIAFVEEWAGERGCEYVALASPLAKERIHRYYRDVGYEKWGYVIETEIGERSMRPDRYSYTPGVRVSPMSDPDELARRVREGDLRLHELDEHADSETAATARRRLLESETDADLDTVGEYAFDADDAAESAVENLIGGAQIPMGVAGPVAVSGGAASGKYYLPLATTEGALVASVNRGLAAIRSAGGADARVTKNGMTRAPVFRVSGVAEAAEVVEWLGEERNLESVRDAAESTTSHGELLGIEPYVVGDSVYLRFAYDTKDAMGMNMATIATRAACEVVESETPASLVAVSGNLCSDKKPAAINAVEGRGRSVTADVVLSGELIEERLGTTPEAISEANTRKNLVGSAKAGSLGFNAHAANTVAAAFLATGQDAAQVVEGANAITTMDVREATASARSDERRSRDEGETDLYASVSLASLEVGTVGGGTTLATQSEALDVLGLSGGGDPAGSNADALAEVIAVGALAGELSLVAALASRHLASAHEDLGR